MSAFFALVVRRHVLLFGGIQISLLGLLVELSPHDQDWVRDTCGDLWLGFEENDLNHWAQKAGLQIGQSSFLSLRNGFQIQIRVFQKETYGT